MIDQITWRTSLEEARVEARQQEKDLLVHLDNPTRDGCGAMRTITYLDPRVIVFVDRFTIPVEFSVAEDQGAQIRFHSFWTPTAIYCDPDGQEHRRTYGCLDPQRFLAEFWLARGLRFLQTGHFRQAAEIFDDAVEHTSVEPDTHAENLYWIAVARYRASGNVQELEAEWRILRREHPTSSWTRRTDFYFQLEDGV